MFLKVLKINKNKNTHKVVKDVQYTRNVNNWCAKKVRQDVAKKMCRIYRQSAIFHWRTVKKISQNIYYGIYLIYLVSN